MKILSRLLLVSFAFCRLNLLPVNAAENDELKVNPETETTEEILRIRQDLAGAQSQFDKVWAKVQHRFLNQPKFLEELQSEHGDWLHFRDTMSHTLGEYGEYARFSPEASSLFMSRKAIYTRDRSRWLRGLLENTGAENDLSGVWWSSMGDSIRIRKTEDKTSFSYSAKSSNGHLGCAAGIIKWNGTKGTFTAIWNTTGEEKGKIRFDLENGLLRVDSEGEVSQFAGERVSFTGKFTRVAPLTERDLERIESDTRFYGPPNVVDSVK